MSMLGSGCMRKRVLEGESHSNSSTAMSNDPSACPSTLSLRFPNIRLTRFSESIKKYPAMLFAHRCNNKLERLSDNARVARINKVVNLEETPN